MVKIENVMNKDVLTTSKDEKMPSLVERMHNHRVGAIVVVNTANEPVGIVTERDILRAIIAYREGLFNKQAQDVMTAPVLTIEADQDIDSAAIQMSLNRIRRIPVVSSDNKLIGLISYRDITNALRKSVYILQEKTEILQEKADRDPLTNLYNRRFLKDELKRQLALAKKSKNPMSVTMIDIDFFKKVNDTYGHQCGDMVLKRLADILVSKSREINVVGRYGGEEFIIIGMISDYKSARYTAERLREAVEAEEFEYEGKKFKITISLGVAVWNQNVKMYKELVKKADEALYTAKREGRNRVVMAEWGNEGVTEKV